VARKSSLDRSIAELAVKSLKSAKTVDELRHAQAVAFPNKFGINLDRTGELIGKSCSSVAGLRKEFAALAKGQNLLRKNWSGCRRQNMTYEEEARMLGPFLDEAEKGGILIVIPIKNAYEQAVGREVPDSTVCRMLARHGWGKLKDGVLDSLILPSVGTAMRTSFWKRSPSVIQTNSSL
jgi:hypothetical protein